MLGSGDTGIERERELNWQCPCCRRSSSKRLLLVFVPPGSAPTAFYFPGTLCKIIRWVWPRCLSDHCFCPRPPECARFCCCCSVAQSCLTLCNPTDCSTSGLPVPHHLLEFAQVHCISDAVQPSHLLTPSSPALNLSQSQGLFQWIICSQQMAKNTGSSASALILPVNIQGWSPLRLTI